MDELRTPHPILHVLVELGIVPSKESFALFHPRVRDRDDVHVLRCSSSGVMI